MIAFSFRLHHSIVQGIDNKVCNGIVLKIKEECIKSVQKEDWEWMANSSGKFGIFKILELMIWTEITLWLKSLKILAHYT